MRPLLLALLLLSCLPVSAGPTHDLSVDGVACGSAWEGSNPPGGDFHRSRGPRGASWDSETTHVQTDETGRIVAVRGETLTMDGMELVRKGDPVARLGRVPGPGAVATAHGAIVPRVEVQDGRIESVALYLQRFQVGGACQALEGGPGKVGLVVDRADPETDSYQARLTAWDGSGKVSWQAPQGVEAFLFGRLPEGDALLEWLGDLGEGPVLLSPAPTLDNGPTVHRRYRWSGTEFVPLPPQVLLESPPRSGTFVWTTPSPDWDWTAAPGRWVRALEGPPSDLRARIQAWSNPSLEEGVARVTAEAQGLQVTAWVEPLR